MQEKDDHHHGFLNYHPIRNGADPARELRLPVGMKFALSIELLSGAIGWVLKKLHRLGGGEPSFEMYGSLLGYLICAIVAMSVPVCAWVWLWDRKHVIAVKTMIYWSLITSIACASLFY